MVEANKNKEQNKISDALEYGLINKHVVEMVDKFTSKNNLSKSVFVDGIIDPGVKSADSLISKMYRKTHIELDKEFSLRDIKDIIRCSIIVDNYNQVIPLIRELRKNIPSLKGDICENETGYMGIHLSLIIDGFNAEIQISTREAWYAKQAGEEIYERWRNFSLAKEVSELWTLTSKEEKDDKIQKLFSHYNLKNIQLNYCKSMFSSLHKYTKLDKLKENINAVLYLNTYNHSELNNNNLTKYNIKIKDVKDKQELLDSCHDYIALANILKKDLLEYANKALNIVKNTQELDNNLTEEEKKFMTLKKKYFSLITKQMKDNFNGEFEVSKYIAKLNKIANKFAFNNISYLDSNLIDALTLDSNDEDIAKLEEIVRRDIFSQNYFLSLIDINNKDN